MAIRGLLSGTYPQIRYKFMRNVLNKLVYLKCFGTGKTATWICESENYEFNITQLSHVHRVPTHIRFGIYYYNSKNPLEIFDGKMLKSNFLKKYPTLKKPRTWTDFLDNGRGGMK
jgi:hypothetical protein